MKITFNVVIKDVSYNGEDANGIKIGTVEVHMDVDMTEKEQQTYFKLIDTLIKKIQ